MTLEGSRRRFRLEVRTFIVKGWMSRSLMAVIDRLQLRAMVFLIIKCFLGAVN